MKKVFLVHGFNSAPNSCFFPWIMKELKTLNIYASALTLANPKKPSLDKWIFEIESKIKENETDEIYLIGHSLGVAAILNCMEKTNIKIKGAVLISGRCQKSNNPLTEEFYQFSDFEKIKLNIGLVSIIHGENDTVVPVENAYILGNNLGVTPMIMKDKGHFTTSEGCIEFPECLVSLVNIMK